MKASGALKALLIPLIGECSFRDIPEECRNKNFQTVVGNSRFPYSYLDLATYKWTGQFSRKDGTILFDIFTEQP